MAVIILAALVLSLVSTGQSAPLTDCTSLTRQVELRGRDQLLGNWRLIGDSSNFPVTVMKKLQQTSWAILTATDEPDQIHLKQIQKILGKCFSLEAKFTLENGTLSMTKPFNLKEVLLTSSCSDCLVISSNTTIGQSTYSGIQLLSRRDTVTPAELDEFKKQVKCLNLPDPLVLNSENGYCPEDSSAQDLTAFFTSDGSDLMGQLDTILKNKGSLDELLQGFINSMMTPREN